MAANEDERALAIVLGDIELNETVYDKREVLVYQALSLAKRLGYKAGIRVDTDPQWPVVCIDLPGCGEVSWHCPAYDTPYTGYDTKVKYTRAAKYTRLTLM